MAVFDKSALFNAMLHQATFKDSTGREITIRSMVNKEYKLLLMASETNKNQTDVIVQVLNNCIVTEGIDARSLCVSDIELLFVQLFKLSKGTSIVNMAYICKNEVDKPVMKQTEDGEVNTGETYKAECGHQIPVSVNLNNIKFTEREVSNEIEINGNVKIFMRDPTLLEFDYFSQDHDNEQIFTLIMRCIDSIQLGDDLFKASDIPDEDLVEIVDHLDENSLTQMSKYVAGIRHITMSFPVKCKHCGYEEVVTLTGIADFFG